MNHIETLPVSDIKKGLTEDDIALFWKVWRENRGLIDERLEDILPLLTVCAASIEETVSPPFVFIGADAFVTRCYGRDWARKALAGGSTPDSSLERMAAAGYVAATEGDASFDLVSVRTQTGTAEIDILYQRLILPIRTAKGHRLLGCITAPVRPTRILSWRGDEGRRRYSTTASRRGGYDAAGRSNGFRPAAYENIPEQWKTRNRPASAT